MEYCVQMNVSISVDTHDTAIAVFAKYPVVGRVKTRLAGASIPGIGTLTLEHTAQLYRAFLCDYIHRHTTEWSVDIPSAQLLFCIRPNPWYAHFEREFGSSSFPVFQEPTYQGHAAADIGQAMGFTIRYLLHLGFRKAIILSSDLPHIPTSAISETIEALESYPLVLGHDGGGCYTVAASEPTEILEDQTIVWSQNTDFDAICKAQTQVGKTFYRLSQDIADIDEGKALTQLLTQLKHDPALRQHLPHTHRLIEQWYTRVSTTRE